eukprot:tig00000498_g1618.t1
MAFLGPRLVAVPSGSSSSAFLGDSVAQSKRCDASRSDAPGRRSDAPATLEIHAGTGTVKGAELGKRSAGGSGGGSRVDERRWCACALHVLQSGLLGRDRYLKGYNSVKTSDGIAFPVFSTCEHPGFRPRNFLETLERLGLMAKEEMEAKRAALGHPAVEESAAPERVDSRVLSRPRTRIQNGFGHECPRCTNGVVECASCFGAGFCASEEDGVYRTCQRCIGRGTQDCPVCIKRTQRPLVGSGSGARR